MKWRVWLFFLSQNTLFHSSNTVLAVSSLTHNHPFPSVSDDSMSGKSSTSVMSVLFLGSTWWWMFGWCWWATMSHFTTTTPTMCAFLLFTPCVFHSHSHHTNGVDVIVSPMVCSTIQPMPCAIHPSLQHNHTLTLASHHNRHTPCRKCHHSKC